MKRAQIYRAVTGALDHNKTVQYSGYNSIIKTFFVNIRKNKTNRFKNRVMRAA